MLGLSVALGIGLKEHVFHESGEETHDSAS